MNVLIQALISARNIENGWGYTTGYSSTPLDTALALQALKAANYPDLSIINPALAYLTNNQNPDGGWGFVPSTGSGQAGDDSNVYLTAIVSSTLQLFPRTTTITAAITKASAYLLIHQNPDGGFGSSPSTAYETALAYAALVGDGRTTDTPLQNAVAYLTATQSADGSWNQDPYSTALALKALYLSEHRPPPPATTGSISGTVVDAATNRPLAGVVIALTGNPSVTAQTGTNGGFSLANVPEGTAHLSVNLAGYDPASLAVSVTAGNQTGIGTIPLTASPTSGIIQGTVSDAASNAPLVGATVAVSGSTTATATTGTNGDYRIVGITPGTVVISASKTGYVAATGTGTAMAGGTLIFSPALGTTPPTATTGDLKGTIVDTTTGRPVVGATVTVTPGAGSPLSTTTEVTGAFRLNGISAGNASFTIAGPGHVSLSGSVTIIAGVVSDLGTIAVSPTTGTVLGTVWDTDTNTPYPNVEVRVTGTGTYQTRTATDGSYAITGILPGTITITTPSGLKPGYLSAPVTATLAPGATLLYSPALGTTPPPSVELTARTDKALYDKGENVVMAFTLRNMLTTANPVTLQVRIAEPAGATVFEKSVAATLPSQTMIEEVMQYSLPATAKGGLYTISVEVVDQSGAKIGGATANFGLVVSRISVTPTLPERFVTGSNRVSFVLKNTGGMAVTSGSLAIVLKDPSGQVLVEAGQAFSLGIGAEATLGYDLTLPPVRFGTYTLTYTRSDETTVGESVAIPLENSVTITPHFDAAEYRVRTTVNLAVGLANIGTFDLAGATGQGATVTVAVPDAGFSGTKPGVPVQGSFQPLLFAIPLPETMSPGEHDVSITVALPSGSTVTRTVRLKVPESALSLALTRSSFTAGETIRPEIGNSGGVDTTVEYRLSLFDVKSTLVTESTGDEPVTAGASIPLSLTIPAGVVDGPYNMVVVYKDRLTGKNTSVPNPLTVAGVKGTLLARTDKESYLTTDTVTSLAAAANTGAVPLQDGNLHLQVVTTAASSNTRTWTTQADFRQGGRDGVDTYGLNDWMVSDDDFARLDTGLWSTYGNVQIQGDRVFIDSTIAQSGMTSRWALEGDFDIQIDFANKASCSAEGAEFGLGGGSFWFYVKNTAGNGREAGALINNRWMAWRSIGGYQPSGKLRIVRSGSTITGYNWDGSSWTNVLSVSNSAYTAKATLYPYVWRGSNCPASCYFDNLKLNYGRIGTQTDISDSVRLLPISDNYDDSTLNADRWSLSKSGNATATETNGNMITAITQAGTQSAAAVAANSPFTNDFDFSIDWKTPVGPATSGWSAAIRLVENGSDTTLEGIPTGAAVKLERTWIAGIGHCYGISRGNGGSWETLGIPVATADTAGRFRVKRSGTAFILWYWNNSLARWEWNGDTAGYSVTGAWTTAAYARFGVLNGSPAWPAAEADWNNFKVAGATYVHSGTLRLKQDAGTTSTWQSLTWNGTTPIGTTISFRTRTADTENGLTTATWSDSLSASGSAITSPRGRWIEIESTLATTDANVTPLLHDVIASYGINPGDIVWETDVPITLTQNSQVEPVNSVGILKTTGKYYLQGVLNSSTGQTVATAEYPFYVTNGNFSLTLSPDKKTYRPSEAVTVSGQVKNLSAISASNLTFMLAQQPAGGVKQTLQSMSLSLASGESRTFSTTVTAGADGTVTLTGTVAQNNIVLASTVDQYRIATPQLTPTLTGPDSAGNEPFTLLLSLVNPGTIDSVVTVANSFGYPVETVTIAAGETKLLPYSQRITGYTTFSITLSGDLNRMLTLQVAYTGGTVPSSVNSTIVTDKISYNAHELATVTSTVTNATSDVMLENLTAWVTVFNGTGQTLYASTMPVSLLTPGQTSSIITQWNVGTSQAGSYFATVDIFDAAGTLLSKARRDFLIENATVPSILLTGRISLDTHRILSGEPVTVSYNVTNAGTADISNVDIIVRTVNPNDQFEYSTFTNRTSLSAGEPFSRNDTIDTTSYGARDYLVLLRARISDTEETLAGTYFRVEGAPSVPALYQPALGSDVANLAPKLAVSNASDPNSDILTYEFEIYEDRNLSSLVASIAQVTETSNITGWTVTPPLVENHSYFWRARAYDGLLYGPWMTPASFRVNTANDPPTAPIVSSPADGTSVSVLKPTLTVSNAFDPDSDTVTYNFDVALDPDFTRIVSSVTGIMSGSTITAWNLPTELQENGRYYWRAQADDWFIAGPWSATVRFLVNTANDPPTAPTIASPAQGTMVQSRDVDIRAENSNDPDSPVLTYFFELDTSPAFDSTHVIRSDEIAEGDEVTLWNIQGLQDNTRYYVRVKASDGESESPWSPISPFTVNLANDPPTAPTLANPSNGAGVAVFTPTLSVHNGTDADLDPLFYEFEIYSDPALTELVARSDRVNETFGETAWIASVALTENKSYFWRARAWDSSLYSPWMHIVSFMVNTANDQPDKPVLISPAMGSTVSTLTPTLSLSNAIDPEGDSLSYEFEIYTGTTHIAASGTIPGDPSGITTWTSDIELIDSATYQWRARAYDGNQYGPWTNASTFSVHLPTSSIAATIDFDPDTFNKSSKGTWVVVYIELPAGFSPRDIDISSIRLEEVVPAEVQPSAVGDYDRDGVLDLMVKFRRSNVAERLPLGSAVPIHITGKVGSVTFNGVDIIRVMN